MLGQTYLSIGALYFKYGEYQDAYNYYKKLYREG